jgi:class 3 adenylate cyclase
MESSGRYRYRPAAMLYAYGQDWFSPYLSQPVRELLDAGPQARSLLRSPRSDDVCILFTDIRGFTELSRSIRPDALFRTLDACIGQQIRIIERYGGYVDNFTGDGLMAVFEGARMTGDACRCALEVVARALPAVRRGGTGLTPIGAGLHCGEVARGTLGSENRLTHTAVGNAVNRAARLAGLARGRDVIISEAIRRTLSPALAGRFVAMPPDSLSGRPDVGSPVYRSRRD